MLQIESNKLSIIGGKAVVNFVVMRGWSSKNERFIHTKKTEYLTFVNVRKLNQFDPDIVNVHAAD